MKTSDVADTLRKAKTFVERGWIKGEVEDSMGRVCAVGAIQMAVFGNTQATSIALSPLYDEYMKVRKVLKEAIGTSVLLFNDNPKTTQADVLAAFDKAIEQEDNKAMWAELESAKVVEAEPVLSV